MIASVVLGLAVDDTIHYLTRFRREHARGVRAAVEATTTGTGRALRIPSYPVRRQNSGLLEAILTREPILEPIALARNNFV